MLRRAEETVAHALAEKLRAIGALVAVEPSPPEFAMPSDISLMSLDGDDSAMPSPSPSPSMPIAPASLLPAPLLPAPILPTPVAAPTVAQVVRDAFSAPPVEASPMELERPAPRAAPAPSHADGPPLEGPPDFEPDDEWQPVPGRLLQGKLRQNPMARLLLGAGLGLLIGYLFAAPYADRAERRVAQLRAAANVDRYRPVDEARANAARLDGEADDLASGAFIRMTLIWLGTAGAVVAGWYRLT